MSFFFFFAVCRLPDAPHPAPLHLLPPAPGGQQQAAQTRTAAAATTTTTAAAAAETGKALVVFVFLLLRLLPGGQAGRALAGEHRLGTGGAPY